VEKKKYFADAAAKKAAGAIRCQIRSETAPKEEALLHRHHSKKRTGKDLPSGKL